MKPFSVLYLFTVLPVVITYFLKPGAKVDLEWEKKYVTHLKKLDHTDITYAVQQSDHTMDMTKEEVLLGLERAFKRWSDASVLTFTKIDSIDNADVKIKFATEIHNDGMDFDGKGNTYAHAFFPGDPRGSEIHFDDDEDYFLMKSSTDNTEGVEFEWIATHEIGHVLGLQHSYDSNDVMYEKYTRPKYNFKLTDDDISGIRAIYGGGGVLATPHPQLQKGCHDSWSKVECSSYIHDGRTCSYNLYKVCSETCGLCTEGVPIHFQHCVPNPCGNGGTCIVQSTGPTCICRPGYGGDDCSINFCDNNPCENGGTCINKEGGYDCKCASRYKGANCDTVIKKEAEEGSGKRTALAKKDDK